jgi:dUTPase
MPSRNDWAIDPFAANPSIQNTFSNFTLYMNNQSGLLAEEIGNTIFQNFTIVDSGYAGVEFQITNFSREFVVAQDFVVVAQSVSNGPSTAALQNVKGLVTPRTDGFMGSNMRFYKFPVGTWVF